MEMMAKCELILYSIENIFKENIWFNAKNIKSLANPPIKSQSV